MKFTKTEIDLCRQIVKKHKKEIKYGDWFYSEHLKEVLLQSPFINLVRDKEIINRDKKAIPLWTISDCLEFLWEKKKQDIISLTTDFPATTKRVWRIVTVTEECWGDTPLEACLKAVLAVLEEK